MLPIGNFMQRLGWFLVGNEWRATIFSIERIQMSLFQYKKGNINKKLLSNEKYRHKGYVSEMDIG